VAQSLTAKETEPVSVGTSDLPRAAREALDRHAWDEAFDLLNRADREGTLSGPDLEALAEAAWFAAHADLGLEAKERAFTAYRAADDPIRAAYLALDLSRQYRLRAKPSISSAWLRRAERLLDGQPEDYAHGYLSLNRAETARDGGEIDAAVELAELAVAIGSRTGDADLEATALTLLGTLRIARGETEAGFGLLEEATVAAVNGELSPFVTGITYCQMIAACRDLSDYRRASEWTEAAARWCERRSVSGFPGICRVHQAEVVALSGEWERAEEQLHRATGELAAYGAMPPLADGFYAIGEIRLRMGDLPGAEEAIRQAHAFGRSPEPLLSMIRLAEGKPREALAGITAAVRDETWDRWARSRLLPAQVEAAIAAGDPPVARAAAEELDDVIQTYESPALYGRRHEAFGRVLLAEGSPVEAAAEVRNAIARWLEVGAPYEVARCRVVLSFALRQLGDDAAAGLELAAARDEFERLGAVVDAAAADRAIGEAAERRAAPSQARKTFLFTDIVGSTNLAELLGNESWERLLRWHDDALRALFARGGGEVVQSTGDGFFVAFDTPRRAIDCAIAIQRTLAEHRRSSGFAPAVRVGLHAALANRRGDDYSGVGVHVAARVAALAGAGEIVASVASLAEAGTVATTDERDVELRGVTGPVRVAAVVWESA
jgi:class 3 adenylate cyclase